MEGPAPSRASAWRVACGAMPGFNGLVASSVPHPQLNADGVCPPMLLHGCVPRRREACPAGDCSSWSHPGGAPILILKPRPEFRQGHPLNLSISISGGKETNRDSLSNGERTGKSPACKSPALGWRIVVWRSTPWMGLAEVYWKVSLERVRAP